MNFFLKNLVFWMINKNWNSLRKYWKKIKYRLNIEIMNLRYE